MASITAIPGFLPILDVVTSSLPSFLVALSLTTIPILVVNLSLVAQYSDLFTYISERFFLRNRPTNEFDFIIVGGGSAGSAVAANLAKKFHVLLIEAGGDPHPLTYIPLMTESLLNLPMIDWRFRTEPLNNSGQIWPGHRMSWPRGRSLGGSSNSNNMVYMRGNPEDFNQWARESGDDTWSYKNVEKVFKTMEDYHGHWEGSAFHGEGGPLYIEKAGFAPTSNEWLEAGKEVGKRVLDPNAQQGEGFFPLDVTQKNGIRFGTFRGYLEPQIQSGNKNLTIHRYSVATKIHFDESLRAFGVTYYRHANKQFAAARNEIILSAGALNSPKLLMLSGIGPKKHLEDMNIKPLVDLKGVGENLQDHVMGMAGPFLLNGNSSFLRSRDLTLENAAEYVALGKGPYSSPDGIAATGLISSSKNENKEWPDILMMHVGRGIDIGMGKQLDSALGLCRNSDLANFLEFNAGNDSNFVFVSVARPKSRGFIKLRTNDPFHAPRIFPKYFSDSDGSDLQTLVEGLQFATRLYENTTTFEKLGARLAPNKFPGCEDHEMKTKEYFECYLKRNIHTMFHPSGTCKMGKTGDEMAVVDSKLRVIGTSGLRVADASVMPFITNANINAPTIMIGEMASKFLHEMYEEPAANNSSSIR